MHKITRNIDNPSLVEKYLILTPLSIPPIMAKDSNHRQDKSGLPRREQLQESHRIHPRALATRHYARR